MASVNNPNIQSLKKEPSSDTETEDLKTDIPMEWHFPEHSSEGVKVAATNEVSAKYVNDTPGNSDVSLECEDIVAVKCEEYFEAEEYYNQVSERTIDPIFGIFKTPPDDNEPDGSNDDHVVTSIDSLPAKDKSASDDDSSSSWADDEESVDTNPEGCIGHGYERCIVSEDFLRTVLTKVICVKCKANDVDIFIKRYCNDSDVKVSCKSCGEVIAKYGDLE